MNPPFSSSPKVSNRNPDATPRHFQFAMTLVPRYRYANAIRNDARGLATATLTQLIIPHA